MLAPPLVVGHQNLLKKFFCLFSCSKFNADYEYVVLARRERELVWALSLGQFIKKHENKNMPKIFFSIYLFFF
jgi:menaquinone-dependent protoporphyrinogen IX oxidase